VVQTDKLNNFMSRSIMLSEIILNAYNQATDLRDEYSKLGLDAATLDAALSETADSDNDHLTGEIVVSLMTSIDNLVTYMNAGNATNFYKLKR